MTVLAVDESGVETGLDGCEAIQKFRHPAEVQLGNKLGLMIHTDDDEDTGFARPLLRTVGDREIALSKAREMKKILLSFGVPEVSIELLPGRPNTYGIYDALFPVCDMSHHTVSRYSPSSLTPVLALCKAGRSDLPGPLCNGYGGWDLCYRILTFGYGNHPGYGGPVTVPALTAGSFTIPLDSARRYAWGTEWEGGLDMRDWDRVLTNPRNGKKMTMREFMGRANAALEVALKIHPEAHLEHSTWTNRKIDRLGYTQRAGIVEKNAYRNKEPEGDWFDMATEADLRKIIQEEVPKVSITTEIVKDGTNKTQPLQQVLRHIMVEQDRIKKMVNPKQLTAAIKAALPTSVDGVTDEELQAAVEKGVRAVFGSLAE